LPVCPKCNQNTLRKIFPTNFIVRVQLSGQEMHAKIQEDSKKIAQHAKNSESFRANLIGENSYHQTQSEIGTVNSNLKQF